MKVIIFDSLPLEEVFNDIKIAPGLVFLIKNRFKSNSGVCLKTHHLKVVIIIQDRLLAQKCVKT